MKGNIMQLQSEPSKTDTVEGQIDARIDELQALQFSDDIPDVVKDQLYIWYIKDRIKQLKGEDKHETTN